MNFVRVVIGRFLTTLRARIERVMLEEAPRDASDVLLNYVRASIRFRAFRTGALQRSPEERFERRGLRGASSVFSDLYYAKFVEFGTGRRGAASGATPPPGYAYGPRAGMTARQPFALGLKAARPEIVKVFERHAERLKRDG
jgi:hypothetical protein